MNDEKEGRVEVSYGGCLEDVCHWVLQIILDKTEP